MSVAKAAKYHIYDENHKAMYLDNRVLEFDTFEDAASFLRWVDDEKIFNHIDTENCVIVEDVIYEINGYTNISASDWRNGNFSIIETVDIPVLCLNDGNNSDEYYVFDVAKQRVKLYEAFELIEHLAASHTENYDVRYFCIEDYLFGYVYTGEDCDPTLQDAFDRLYCNYMRDPDDFFTIYNFCVKHEG